MEISISDGYWFVENRKKRDLIGIQNLRDAIDKPKKVTGLIGEVGCVVVRELALTSNNGSLFEIDIVSSKQINVRPKKLVFWDQIDRRVTVAIETALKSRALIVRTNHCC